MTFCGSADDRGALIRSNLEGNWPAWWRLRSLSAFVLAIICYYSLAHLTGASPVAVPSGPRGLLCVGFASPRSAGVVGFSSQSKPMRLGKPLDFFVVCLSPAISRWPAHGVAHSCDGLPPAPLGGKMDEWNSTKKRFPGGIHFSLTKGMWSMLMWHHSQFYIPRCSGVNTF